MFCLGYAASVVPVGPSWSSKPRFYKQNIIYASSGFNPILQQYPFPKDYDELLKQAGHATQAALDDSKKLLEIEVPPAGLHTVPGDEEGGVEMNKSMGLVQEFCQSTFGGIQEPRTRVFFPELVEMNLAKSGVFEGTTFKLDYLTKPSPWNDIGLGKKVKVTERMKETDNLFVIAYPHFNPDEMLAVEELYHVSARQSGCPILVFNGDLDKIRSGCILFILDFHSLWIYLLTAKETIHRCSTRSSLHWPRPSCLHLRRFTTSTTSKARLMELCSGCIQVHGKSCVGKAARWSACTPKMRCQL